MRQGGELPLFRGCLLSSTGLSIERRTEVARIVWALGGMFTPDLMVECTHLLVQTPDSDKFKVAKTAWGHIKCVNENWFWNSVSQNVRLDESLYPIPGASVPILEKSTSGDGQDQEPAGILEQPGVPSESDVAVSGAAAARSTSVERNDFYLSGCRIYITGFDSGETKRLVNMVLEGGGTRFVAFHDGITHLILGNPSQSEMRDIRQQAAWGAVHVVLPTWLEECTRHRQELAVTTMFAVPQNLLSQNFHLPPGRHRMLPLRERIPLGENRGGRLPETRQGVLPADARPACNGPQSNVFREPLASLASNPLESAALEIKNQIPCRTLPAAKQVISTEQPDVRRCASPSKETSSQSPGKRSPFSITRDENSQQRPERLANGCSQDLAQETSMRKEDLSLRPVEKAACPPHDVIDLALETSMRKAELPLRPAGKAGCPPQDVILAPISIRKSELPLRPVEKAGCPPQDVIHAPASRRKPELPLRPVEKAGCPPQDVIHAPASRRIPELPLRPVENAGCPTQDVIRASTTVRKLELPLRSFKKTGCPLQDVIHAPISMRKAELLLRPVEKSGCPPQDVIHAPTSRRRPELPLRPVDKAKCPPLDVIDLGETCKRKPELPLRPVEIARCPPQDVIHAPNSTTCTPPVNLVSQTTFKGLVFEFAPSFQAFVREEVIQWVEEGGGVMLGDDKRGELQADYIIVPHGEKKDESPRFHKRISTHWIKICLQEGKLIDINTHILFQPLCCDIPLPGFEKMHFSVTQCDEMERALLRNLCHIIGATFHITMRKKTTHLLCKVVGGEKYEAALLWGTIQIVTVKWLYMCVTQNCLVPLEHFRPKELTESDKEAGLRVSTQNPEPPPANNSGRSSTERYQAQKASPVINVREKTPSVKRKPHAQGKAYFPPLEMRTIQCKRPSIKFPADSHRPSKNLDPWDRLAPPMESKDMTRKTQTGSKRQGHNSCTASGNIPVSLEPNRAQVELSDDFEPQCQPKAGCSINEGVDGSKSRGSRSKKQVVTESTVVNDENIQVNAMPNGTRIEHFEGVEVDNQPNEAAKRCFETKAGCLTEEGQVGRSKTKGSSSKKRPVSGRSIPVNVEPKKTKVELSDSLEPERVQVELSEFLIPEGPEREAAVVCRGSGAGTEELLLVSKSKGSKSKRKIAMADNLASGGNIPINLESKRSQAELSDDLEPDSQSRQAADVCDSIYSGCPINEERSAVSKSKVLKNKNQIVSSGSESSGGNIPVNVEPEGTQDEISDDFEPERPRRQTAQVSNGTKTQLFPSEGLLARSKNKESKSRKRTTSGSRLATDGNIPLNVDPNRLQVEVSNIRKPDVQSLQAAQGFHGIKEGCPIIEKLFAGSKRKGFKSQDKTEVELSDGLEQNCEREQVADEVTEGCPTNEKPLAGSKRKGSKSKNKTELELPDDLEQNCEREQAADRVNGGYPINEKPLAGSKRKGSKTKNNTEVELSDNLEQNCKPEQAADEVNGGCLIIEKPLAGFKKKGSKSKKKTDVELSDGLELNCKPNQVADGISQGCLINEKALAGAKQKGSKSKSKTEVELCMEQKNEPEQAAAEVDGGCPIIEKPIAGAKRKESKRKKKTEVKLSDVLEQNCGPKQPADVHDEIVDVDYEIEIPYGLEQDCEPRQAADVCYGERVGSPPKRKGSNSKSRIASCGNIPVSLEPNRFQIGLSHDWDDDWQPTQAAEVSDGVKGGYPSTEVLAGGSRRKGSKSKKRIVSGGNGALNSCEAGNGIHYVGMENEEKTSTDVASAIEELLAQTSKVQSQGAPISSNVDGDLLLSAKLSRRRSQDVDFDTSFKRPKRLKLTAKSSTLSVVEELIPSATPAADSLERREESQMDSQVVVSYVEEFPEKQKIMERVRTRSMPSICSESAGTIHQKGLAFKRLLNAADANK